MPEEHDGAGLHVAVHTAPEQLSGAWDALADRLDAPPFMRPGWIVAWSRAFAAGRLSALSATRVGELVGLLPFIQRRGVLAAPVNWHTPVFGFLAADRAIAAALSTSFISRARLRADLSFLDRDDPNLAECLRAARDARRRVVVRCVQRSPYVALAHSSWETYRSSLERKARKDLERRRRRLEEQGVVSVQFWAERADPGGLLEEGFRLEASGWKHKRGTAISSGPATQRFYSDVARWAGSRGWLLLAFLRLDGRPIAFDLCLQRGGAAYVLKGGFDPDYRRFAPGMLLTYESLRRAFERGLASYELLGGDEPYKLTWTQSVRERVRFQAFSRSPGGRANHLAWTLGRAQALRVLALTRRADPRRAAAG